MKSPGVFALCVRRFALVGTVVVFMVFGLAQTIRAQSTQGGNDCKGKCQWKKVGNNWVPEKVVCGPTTCAVPAGSQCLVKSVGQTTLVINGQSVQVISMQCMCYKSQQEFAVDMVAGNAVCDATEFRDAMDPGVVVAVGCYGYCSGTLKCEDYDEVITSTKKTFKCRCQ